MGSQITGSLLVSLIGAVGTFYLNRDKRPVTSQSDLYGFFVQCNYHLVFVAQGITNQVWRQKMKAESDYLRSTSLNPLIVLTFSFLLQEFLFPGWDIEIGAPYFFPLYKDHFLRHSFVFCAWFMVYFVEWNASEFGCHMFVEPLDPKKKEADASFYFDSVGSSVVVLFAHKFVFSKIKQFLIKPMRESGYDFMPMLAVACCGTPLICVLIYKAFSTLTGKRNIVQIE